MKTSMKEQIISIVITISLIIVGTLISYFYPQHINIKDSIYIGLFSYLISILFFFTKKLDTIGCIPDIRTDVKNISNHLLIEEKLKKHCSDSFGIFWNLCLLRAEEGIYKLNNPNSITVPKEQFPSFWQQAILNTDINWNCTNYTNLPEDLYSDWAKKGFNFQSMVSKTMDVPVKRLYILKNRNEFDQRFIDHLKWQQSLGFNVKFIIKDKKTKWAPFKELEEIIETIDVAIINGRYLIAFILTDEDQRGISCLKVYSDRTILSKVNDIFQHLWGSANHVESIDH